MEALNRLTIQSSTSSLFRHYRRYLLSDHAVETLDHIVDTRVGMIDARLARSMPLRLKGLMGLKGLPEMIKGFTRDD